MRVVFKDPCMSPTLVDIPNELHDLQKAVGGFIETVRFSKECILICNEMGRILELDPNTFGICGPFLIVGDGGEEFRSLTDEEADMVLRLMERRKS